MGMVWIIGGGIFVLLPTGRMGRTGTNIKQVDTPGFIGTPDNGDGELK